MHDIFHLSLNQAGKFTIRIPVAPTISEDYFRLNRSSEKKFDVTCLKCQLVVRIVQTQKYVTYFIKLRLGFKKIGENWQPMCDCSYRLASNFIKQVDRRTSE
jgi:hypothetical protein